MLMLDSNHRPIKFDTIDQMLEVWYTVSISLLLKSQIFSNYTTSVNKGHNTKTESNLFVLASTRQSFMKVYANMNWLARSTRSVSKSDHDLAKGVSVFNF